MSAAFLGLRGTKPRTPGGLKPQKRVSSHRSAGQTSEIQVWAGLLPWEDLRENPFQFLVAAAGKASLCFLSRGRFTPLCLVSPRLSSAVCVGPPSAFLSEGCLSLALGPDLNLGGSPLEILSNICKDSFQVQSQPQIPGGRIF